MFELISCWLGMWKLFSSFPWRKISFEPMIIPDLKKSRHTGRFVRIPIPENRELCVVARNFEKSSSEWNLPSNFLKSLIPKNTFTWTRFLKLFRNAVVMNWRQYLLGCSKSLTVDIFWSFENSSFTTHSKIGNKSL